MKRTRKQILTFCLIATIASTGLIGCTSNKNDDKDKAKQTQQIDKKDDKKQPETKDIEVKARPVNDIVKDGDSTILKITLDDDSIMDFIVDDKTEIVKEKDNTKLLIKDITKEDVLDVTYDSATKDDSTPPRYTAKKIVVAEKKVAELVYGGKIEEITTDGDKKSLLVKNDSNSIIFHVTKDTVLSNDKKEDIKFEDLKKDQTVKITFDGALTRSIPAQGNALKIEVMTLTTKAPDKDDSKK